MFKHGHFHKVTAIVVLLLTVAATTPVSAADLKSPSPLGSVSTVGSVQLRGIQVAQEGTLFSGDQLQSAAKGYAKVVLLDGQKIELDASTDVTVGRQNDGVQVQLRSGNMAFTTTKTTAFRVGAGSYEVVISKPSAGNIAIVGTDYMGLRVKSGTATVRNLKTKESFVVQSGQERLLGLQGYGERQSLGQIASTLPGPVPPMPQAAGSSSGLSRTGWIAVLATVGGAALAITILSTRDNEDEATPAELQAKQKALGNLAAITATSTATATLATQTNVAAGQATTAIAAATNLTAAQKTQFTTDAATATTNSAAANAKVATLSTTVSQLQGRIASSTVVSATDQTALNQALIDLEAARVQANNALNTLLTLLATLRTLAVANTPANPASTVVPPAAVVSASIPL